MAIYRYNDYVGSGSGSVSPRSGSVSASWAGQTVRVSFTAYPSSGYEVDY